MTQPPVRYENYPPDDTSPPSLTDEQVPTVRPYVPEAIPAPQGGYGTPRRSVVSLVIGVPLALVLFSAVASSGNSIGTMGDDYPFAEATAEETEDSGQGTDESGGWMFSVGGHSASAPEGWTVTEDGGDVVRVTKGTNLLTAVSLELAASSVAVEEVPHLAKKWHAGFTGKIGTPVDRSSAERQHATMDGHGKYRGKAARLLAELWVDDAGMGLLVVRILTAKPNAPASVEAQGIVDELSAEL